MPIQGSYFKYVFTNKPVLVSWGCYNKITWIRWLNNRHFFLTVLEAWSPRSRCWQIWFLVRALFLACIWPPSHCVLTWQRVLWCLSFHNVTDPIMKAPLSWPHLTLITSQRLYLQIPLPCGAGSGVGGRVRASTYDLGERNAVGGHNSYVCMYVLFVVVCLFPPGSKLHEGRDLFCFIDFSIPNIKQCHILSHNYIQ